MLGGVRRWPHPPPRFRSLPSCEQVSQTIRPGPDARVLRLHMATDYYPFVCHDVPPRLRIRHATGSEGGIDQPLHLGEDSRGTLGIPRLVDVTLDRPTWREGGADGLSTQTAPWPWRGRNGGRVGNVYRRGRMGNVCRWRGVLYHIGPPAAGAGCGSWRKRCKIPPSTPPTAGLLLTVLSIVLCPPLLLS